MHRISRLHKRQSSQAKEVDDSGPGTPDTERLTIERFPSEPSGSLKHRPALKRPSTQDPPVPEVSALHAPQQSRHRSRSSSPSVDRLGLSLVHAVPEPLADLIFVHGLGGSSWRTWSWQHDTANFWPSWLSRDPELCRARVFTFGYNADFSKTDAPSNILGFARELLFQMKTYSGTLDGNEPSVGKHPIIFVVHSMGGLVVKRAYTVGKSDDQYQAIIARVSAILFLATPHRGSAYADFLNNILRSTPTLSSKIYVSELERTSMSLQDINEQFRTACGDLELVSLYETQKTHLGFGIRKMIVEKDSAVLGYPTEISSGLAADHHGVCKFRAVDDPNYEQVRNVLHMFVKRLQPQGESDASTIAATSPLGIANTPASNRTKLEQLLGVHDDPKTDLDILQDRAMDGSCHWILDRDVFRNWKGEADTGPQLLWLTGLPGVGKSILSSFIIDLLQKQPSTSCCYYFFNSDHQSKRTVSHMLRSIAFQMSLACKILAAKLVGLHDSGSLHIEQQKTKSVWESVFETIILRHHFEQRIFWIVDGLDEADHPELFTKILSKLDTRAPFKILLVSRPMKEMAMQPLTIDFAHDEITARDTQDDIRSYTETAVNSILVHNKEARDSICDKVLAKAQGSFLWVTLAMEQLKDNWHTVDDIDRILNSLPEGMEFLYGRMIHTIASQAARPRAIASRILTWAVCSFHPLELGELEVALALDFGEFLSLKTTVTQLCANFVVVKKTRVALIHDTARSFLLSPTGGQPLAIDPESGHEYIALTCLRFLMDKTKNWKRLLASAQPSMSQAPDTSHPHRKRPPLFDSHPFLSYAVTWWAYHLSLSPPSGLELTQLLHEFLDNFCLVWIHAVALLGDMRVLTRAAKYIKLFVKRKKKKSSFESLTSLEATRDDDLKQWSNDLVRLVGRFGDILLRSPLSIHKHIAPFCPSGSMIHHTYGRMGGILVVGISGKMWDDCVARLPMGPDEYATQIACKGAYFVTLIGHGVLIVWHAESCEEARRLQHGEWISVIACGKVSSLVATAGTKTIRVWDLATGEEVYCLVKSTDRRILVLSFGKGDEELLIGYDDSSVRCIELQTGDEKWGHSFEGPGDTEHLCPHLISISPDHFQVIVAYRGKPMFAWNVDMLDDEPQVCTRSEDRLSIATAAHDASAWKAGTPEWVVWRPGLPSVLVLYNDAALFEWNIEDDTLRQIPDIAAREVALSTDGNALLTSDHNGVLSVWSVPQFRLMYRLQETDMVRGLAFSPDGQRFYDIRGPLCNVWEPDALIRPDDLDRDEVSVSHDTSLSEPISAVAVTARPDITALVSDTEDRFHCCGNDSGVVVMHDTRTGERVRKLYGHATISCVIQMAWSRASHFIASADDCGRVIVKRLRKPTPENNTWGVYPLLDFRPGDAVLQLLFNASEEYFLVASSGSTGVWNLRTRKRVCLSERPPEPGMRWTNHPTNAALLLHISSDGVRLFKWESLVEVEPSTTDITRDPPSEGTELLASLSLQERPSGGGTRFNVERPVAVNARQVVFIASPDAGSQHYPTRRRNVMVGDLDSPVRPWQPEPVDDISTHLNRLIGSFHGHLVFLDHHYCLCTWNLRAGVTSLKRHFYLPKDWLSPSMLGLCVLNEHGSILCPKNGEVAVIRDGFKL